MPQISRARGKVKTALTTLKIQLLQRGWDYSGLAKKTGIQHAQVKAIACGARQSRYGRRKIEAALDTPIWSTPEQHEQNQRLTRALGVDPILASHEQLRRAAVEAGLFTKSARFPSREGLLANIGTQLEERSK